MTSQRSSVAMIRCAIYTRKSSEEGLQQEFNSLDAQRESAEAFITSQRSEGWVCLPDRYDDGGFTGGNMDRPALKRLLADIEAKRVDCVVVYKLDRLSRSLLDFTKMVEVFDRHNVSFVSTTQQFNTGTSMGRLMLNVLLSFAQFEREIISERTRDKIAATRRKGKWSGGQTILGYDVGENKKLVVNAREAKQVRRIFELYAEHRSMLPVVRALAEEEIATKVQTTREGTKIGGRAFSKASLYRHLTNPLYAGLVGYKGELNPGEQEGIVPAEEWEAVQRMIRGNGRTRGSGVRTSVGAILKGLIRCKACDAAMTPAHTKRKNKTYRYYTCLNAQKNGWAACPSKSIPAAEIERVVIDRLRCVGRDDALLHATLAEAQRQDEERVEALESDKREQERERTRLTQEFRKLSQQYAGDEAKLVRAWGDRQEALKRCEDRINDLRQKLFEARGRMVSEDETREVLRTFDPVWESLTTAEQGRIVGLLIERVEYDGSSGRLSLTFYRTGIRTLAEEIASEQPTTRKERRA
jgi:site-specific DNA recombinase